MLHLVTGKKGSGKGLYLLSVVEKRRITENRKVYYHGIPDLKLDWTEIDDPKQWYTLPPNSIIVLDEADLYFPVRPNASAVPDYISMFKFDRKTGLDIYVATQDPTFIDSFVRKSSDIHYHLMRKFGDEVSVLHQFTTVRDDVAKNRKDSISKDFHFPKEYYGSYTSAEIHNIPNHTPFRYYLKFIIPVLVVALCFFAYQQFNKAAHSGEKTANEKKLQLTAPGETNFMPISNSKNKEDDPNYYFTQNTPRVQNLPYSAPKYDEVTKPKSAPFPAACMVSKSKGCTCFSQQGTKLFIENSVCLNIVENGLFQDFDPDGQNSKGNNQESQKVASGYGVQPHVDQQSNNASEALTRYVEPKL
jgi:zona occludens toxin